MGSSYRLGSHQRNGMSGEGCQGQTWKHSRLWRLRTRSGRHWGGSGKWVRSWESTEPGHLEECGLPFLEDARHKTFFFQFTNSLSETIQNTCWGRTLKEKQISQETVLTFKELEPGGGVHIHRYDMQASSFSPTVSYDCGLITNKLFKNMAEMNKTLEMNFAWESWSFCL